MHDPIADAALAAAEHGAPPMVLEVGPNADVDFGAGRNPFDGMQLTPGWTDADVAAGRSE